MNRLGSDRRPIIGVTSKHGASDWIERNTAHYLAVLRAHGAEPVVLSPDAAAALPDGASFTPGSDGTLPASVLDVLDGILLSGGGDVHPGRFGQEIDGAEPDRIDERRDALELSLAQAAMQRDIPLFGICRGCQVLNVAAGGSLVQHFDGHRSPEDRTSYHEVEVCNGTLLIRMTGLSRLRVNTFHHQGINAASLAPGLTASGLATPDDWLIEAIESPRHRWVMGVQWHPERVFELDASHERIWQSFVSACDGHW